MTDMDFDLTSKVIPSLLNKIIYANSIGLKVSEIEGDAVLFFKTGELPSLNDLITQCKQFYTDFYAQLDILRKKHNGVKGADKIPKMLGLKIVLHYGEEIGLVQIEKRIKLMGEDVITAHRLLKNDLTIDEYILISDDLISQFRKFEINNNFEWDTLKVGSMELDHIGTVKFNYIDLTPLIE